MEESEENNKIETRKSEVEKITRKHGGKAPDVAQWHVTTFQPIGCTVHTLNDTATSRDDLPTSSDPAPEPEAPPAVFETILQRILSAPPLSAPPKMSHTSTSKVNFHSIASLL